MLRVHFPFKLVIIWKNNFLKIFNECFFLFLAGPSLRYGGPRSLIHGNEHLTASAGSVGTQGVTANSSGAAPSPQQPLPRGIFGRLGIRKPSILSLTSHHSTSSQQQEASGSGGGNSDAAPRTFSLDDLLKPAPRRKTTKVAWNSVSIYNLTIPNTLLNFFTHSCLCQACLTIVYCFFSIYTDTTYDCIAQ